MVWSKLVMATSLSSLVTSERKPPKELKIGQGSRNDYDTMIKWAAMEGLNPGLNSAACCYSINPKALTMARLDGEPAGCLLLTTYQPNYAVLGRFVTRSDLRRRGIGLAVWRKVMSACTEITTVGLDSVLGQVGNYEKSGFVQAYRTMTYAGVPSICQHSLEGIIPIDTSMLDTIASYDRTVFSMQLVPLLSALLRSPQYIGRAIIEGGQVTGYGVVYPCHGLVHTIGPLYAENIETAERLFDALVAESGAGQVLIFVPEPNTLSIDLCRRRGMKIREEYVRMYRGPAPTEHLEKIFGLPNIG